jgi:hypothetical protein
MITIKNIETSNWNKTIEFLINDSWSISSEYYCFDKGIDYDSKTLKKGKERIYFEWDNWTGGEIRCNEATVKYIEKLIVTEFEEKQKSQSWISRLFKAW